MTVKKMQTISLSTIHKQSMRLTTHFYVDDGLTGTDSPKEAIDLHEQLQALFSKGGFLLRKWNSIDPTALRHTPAELRDSQCNVDHFRLTIADLPPLEGITKRILVSDIAKTFDVLGWFSPSIIKVKINLQ